MRATAVVRLASLAIVLGTGCASLVRGTSRASRAGFGLAPAEQALRVALAEARWDAALHLATTEKPGGPGDRLLRDLYAGTAAYYAGRWDSSAAAFERADALADDRFTKSASRGALALATNDLALPYVPGQNERLLVHYYGMLAWLRRGSVEEAAVEARRLGALLQQYDDGRTPLDAPARAMLRYVSGAVFEAAGETEDAAVAYRNARQLAGLVATADSTPSDSAPNGSSPDAPPARRAGGRTRGTTPRIPVKALAAAPVRPVVPPDSGDVVLVLEQGFVAHRVEQRLTVRANDAGDRHVFAGGGRDGDAIARAASLLTGDEGLWADGPVGELTLAAPVDSAPPLDVSGVAGPMVARSAVADVTSALDVGRVHARSSERDGHRDDSWSTRLRVAWPAYRRAAPVPSAALVVDSGVATTAPLLRASLSDAAAGDFRRDRTARLTRVLVRAALREAAVSELRRKHHDLGSLARTVGGAMEHADTRSWHLLPATIAVTRVRLRAGDHVLATEVNGERVPIGTVRVIPGGVTVTTARLWGSARVATVAARDTVGAWAATP